MAAFRGGDHVATQGAGPVEIKIATTALAGDSYLEFADATACRIRDSTVSKQK
jgi:hypothetical protein